MANESRYSRGGVEENRRRLPEPGTHTQELDWGVLFHCCPNAAGEQRTGDSFLLSCHWTRLGTSAKAKCSNRQLKRLREGARNQAPRIKHSWAAVAAFATWAKARYTFCMLWFYIVRFWAYKEQSNHHHPIDGGEWILYSSNCIIHYLNASRNHLLFKTVFSLFSCSVGSIFSLALLAVVGM